MSSLSIRIRKYEKIEVKGVWSKVAVCKSNGSERATWRDQGRVNKPWSTGSTDRVRSGRPTRMETRGLFGPFNQNVPFWTKYKS